jgi:hypothetical protein
MQPAQAVQAAADGEAVSEAQIETIHCQGRARECEFVIFVGYNRDINQPRNIGIFYGE